MERHLSPPDPRILRLTLPSDARYLSLLRSTVQAILYVEGLPQSEIQKMALAIEQAGEGIIRQAYDEGTNREDSSASRHREKSSGVSFD